MRSIIDYRGHPVTRAALLFSGLVFQRPGNVRAAERSEIDLDGALWTVPSDKMKRTLREAGLTWSRCRRRLLPSCAICTS